jgi:hypothetical protein
MSPKGNDFSRNICGKHENKAYIFESNTSANRVTIIKIGTIITKVALNLKRLLLNTNDLVLSSNFYFYPIKESG